MNMIIRIVIDDDDDDDDDGMNVFGNYGYGDPGLFCIYICSKMCYK